MTFAILSVSPSELTIAVSTPGAQEGGRPKATPTRKPRPTTAKKRPAKKTSSAKTKVPHRIEGNRGLDTSVAVRYQGKTYQTTYQRQTGNDGPIDVYFYTITLPDGAQAMQKGEKLWGRFVRVPAADSPNATSVEWWHATWVQRGGVWELVDTKGAQFEVLGTATTGTPGTKSNRANDTALAFEGPGIRVRYQGRIYQTVYRTSSENNGVPMDLYYYQITLPDGTQATQNGEKLWGRFVRMPAADFPTLTSVERWHATWVQRGGVWEQVDTKGAQFEVLREK